MCFVCCFCVAVCVCVCVCVFVCFLCLLFICLVEVGCVFQNMEVKKLGVLKLVRFSGPGTK